MLAHLTGFAALVTASVASVVILVLASRCVGINQLIQANGLLVLIATGFVVAETHLIRCTVKPQICTAADNIYRAIVVQTNAISIGRRSAGLQTIGIRSLTNVITAGRPNGVTTLNRRDHEGIHIVDYNLTISNGNILTIVDSVQCGQRAVKNHISLFVNDQVSAGPIRRSSGNLDPGACHRLCSTTDFTNAILIAVAGGGDGLALIHSCAAIVTDGLAGVALGGATGSDSILNAGVGVLTSRRSFARTGGGDIGHLNVSNTNLAVGLAAGIAHAEGNRGSTHFHSSAGFNIAAVIGQHAIIVNRIGNCNRLNSVALSSRNHHTGTFGLIDSPLLTVDIILTGVAATICGNGHHIIHHNSRILRSVCPTVCICIGGDVASDSGFGGRIGINDGQGRGNSSAVFPSCPILRNILNLELNSISASRGIGRNGICNDSNQISISQIVAIIIFPIPCNVTSGHIMLGCLEIKVFIGNGANGESFGDSCVCSQGVETDFLICFDGKYNSLGFTAYIDCGLIESCSKLYSLIVCSESRHKHLNTQC